MKALTVKDPWATLIAYGAKVYETRSWSTPYRGEIALHASKAFPRYDQEMCMDEPFFKTLTACQKMGLPNMLNDWPRGAVIALADLVDVVRIQRVNERGDVVDCDESAGVHYHSHDDVVTVGGVPLTGQEEDFGLYCSHRYAWRFDNVRRIVPVSAKGALGLWVWVAPC